MLTDQNSHRSDAHIPKRKNRTTRQEAHASDVESKDIWRASARNEKNSRSNHRSSLTASQGSRDHFPPNRHSNHSSRLFRRSPSENQEEQDALKASGSSINRRLINTSREPAPPP